MAPSSLTNAIATGTNSTTPIGSCLRSKASSSAAPLQTGSSSRLLSSAIILSSLPVSSTQNSKANPTNRTPFSKASSPPRTTTPTSGLCDVTKYEQAVEFLYGLQVFGTKFGLEKPRRLAELAGNPQRGLRFIHVAGTNGKGSTCAMLESIYRGAGLRVGLYTSPHLVRFGERVQVNRELISEAEIVRLVNGTRSWLKHFSEEDHATFFEVVTVMA